MTSTPATNPQAHKPALAAKTGQKPTHKPAYKARPAGPSALRGTQDARRQAALVLEVLCGMRSPIEAAKVMGVALPRYYLLETRALQGLINALEPLPRGPGRNPQAEIEALQRQLQRQKQELARGQSLLRASQRALGLPAAPPRDQKRPEGKLRKPKRPTVRALKAVAALRAGNELPAAEPPAEVAP